MIFLSSCMIAQNSHIRWMDEKFEVRTLAFALGKVYVNWNMLMDQRNDYLLKKKNKYKLWIFFGYIYKLWIKNKCVLTETII